MPAMTGPGTGQLVLQLPSTGGDEKKVGYYAGIIVSDSCSNLMLRGVSTPIRCHSTLSARPPLDCCGADSQMLSDANPFFSKVL